MIPARLDISELGLCDECADRAHQEIRRRRKIGIEDGDILGARALEPSGERAGLVGGALDAMQQLDLDAFATQPGDGLLARGQ